MLLTLAEDVLDMFSSGGFDDRVNLSGCIVVINGDLDIGDLDLYRFWRQLSQNLTNLDKIKTNKDK